MITEWDYTKLAAAYLARPDYSPAALNKMLEQMKLPADAIICDVGAGVAHLTIPLAKKGFSIIAVEPNDAMRAYGKERTNSFPRVSWFEGTGESTGQADHSFDLVTFGSSFNVTNREIALQEVRRILKPKGWLAVMWNHRNLEDPIQFKIEKIIKSHIPNYSYGTRRENPEEVINASGYFDAVIPIEGEVHHQQSVESVVAAWRSHATLHRQAGDQFESIIYDIEDMLFQLSVSEIAVPYTTRIWITRLS